VYWYVVYLLSLVYSKLWTRNKPGDEMTDKYNTSTHNTAGESTELGKTLKLCLCITFFKI